MAFCGSREKKKIPVKSKHKKKEHLFENIFFLKIMLARPFFILMTRTRIGP